MAFQSQVNIYTALGVQGALAVNSPVRAVPYNLYSAGQAQIMGYAFTISSGGNPAPSGNSMLAGTAQVGGTGIFAGILVNPLEQASYGTTGNPLAATLTLPDYSNGALLQMGEIFVTLATAGNVGDLVFYDNTTGALDRVAPSSSFTGVVATNTLTVSAFVSGGAPLRIGSVIAGTGVDVGTVITALGSGTGGNGTYTVNGQATVSSTAMTGTAVAASGKTFIPRCIVNRYDVAANTSLAVIKLTN